MDTQGRFPVLRTQVVPTYATRETAPQPARSLLNREPPSGYTYTVVGDECIIEHERGGMSCLNLFLGLWLSGWTAGCVFLTYEYFFGGPLKGREEFPLWALCAFWFPWFLVSFLLLYLNFARKTFRLTGDALQIETRLLFLKWLVALPRESITEIKQVQDGGRGRDSFPSWGLRLRAAAVVASITDRLMLFNNFGRNHRFRWILRRLPYEHSKWLGLMLAEWSGVEAQFCPKPDAEPEDGGERP